MHRAVPFVLLALLAAAGPARGERRVAAPPPPKEFARVFIGVTTAYAYGSGAPERIGHADCVEASLGHYMCSYALSRPGSPRECHIMQARWTPQELSTITVTLAGRTTRCGSLREALGSLR